jgi:hypothetical protein
LVEVVIIVDVGLVIVGFGAIGVDVAGLVEVGCMAGAAGLVVVATGFVGIGLVVTGVVVATGFVGIGCTTGVVGFGAIGLVEVAAKAIELTESIATIASVAVDIFFIRMLY